MSADRMPISRGLTRLADIPDGELLVIRAARPTLAEVPLADLSSCLPKPGDKADAPYFLRPTALCAG
jgi:hypothetical protein